MLLKIRNKEFQVSSQPSDYWGWINEGRYDHEWVIYDTYLKPEHTFVDCGAWVGAHSLYASSIAKRVIAVEPDPIAFDILKNNVGKDVTLICKAVSDRDEIVTMGSGLLGASTTRTNPSAGSGIGPWIEGQTFDVECVSLSELLAEVPDPLFIKIDVEGSEEKLFNSSVFTERKPTVLIELHPFWWTNPEVTWKAFESLKARYSNAVEICGNTWVLFG